MWPFKKKTAPAINTHQASDHLTQVYGDFLSADEQKSTAAKLAILKIVRNDASFYTPEYQMKQVQIADRLLSSGEPLAAQTFLRFIEKDYIGDKLEPMIDCLLRTDHSDDLVALLAQDKIQPELGSSTALQNRAILIRYLVKYCIATANHSLALSLIRSFNDRDNQEEAIEGVGMDIPFAETLSVNGEDALLAALKQSKGYNQIALLCRSLEDVGTDKTIGFLSGRGVRRCPRPGLDRTFTSKDIAKVTRDRITWRLAEGEP
ncbi:MAG: hypothetical protein Q8K82_03055 [Gemmatimonadaceae bacterium]|nr:hypothetical protein [Gemmatimonadaceae bacterium]